EVAGLEERGQRRSWPTSGMYRNRRTERWPTRRRGLSASSNAWPIMLHARITSATRIPGGTIAHHAPLLIAAFWTAFSMILPREILLGSPSPRNDSAVSSNTATAIVRTVFAI